MMKIFMLFIKLILIIFVKFIRFIIYFLSYIFLWELGGIILFLTILVMVTSEMSVYESVKEYWLMFAISFSMITIDIILTNFLVKSAKKGRLRNTVKKIYRKINKKNPKKDDMPILKRFFCA